MIRILKNFLINIIWQYMFYSISRIDFRRLISNVTIIFNTMSLRELSRLCWDIILNKVHNNRFIRMIGLQNPVDTRIIFDTNNKKFFWLSILFSLTIFRWFIYLKKIFLWPFKLGIFSFFYSLFGIDFSWFLGLFDFFYINIPHWVYIQYLTLYNNWLNWWHSTVNIKNLNTIPLPERLDKSKNLELGEPVDSNLDESNNKISKNKKIILITLTIIAIVGLGIWYYYYSDVGGTGGGMIRK